MAEGYLCDPQWKACMIPNTAVIVPKQCPVPRGPARDAAFGASHALSSAATAGLSQRGPSAIVTDAGDVLALFDSRRGPLDAGQLGSAIAGASGVRPTGFPASEGDRSDVQVARDRKGIFYAVWLEVEGRHRQIALARSRDGGRTWTGPHPVDAADCDDQDRACLDRPMIAIGAAAPSTGNDLVHVFYAAGGGLRVATSLDEGATFRAPITAVPGHHGTATVGPDGRIHAVVLDPATSLPGFGSADHRVLYTVSTDNGRSFAPAQKLSGRDEILPYFGARPSVAVDPRRGYVYAAYVRGGRDAVWDLVLLASKDRGKTWKRTTIGDGCSIHMIPTLALDPATGVLHVAWYEPRGFAHAACKAGLASCTPLGAINDVPFASLSLERDAPRSLGESATLLVDDRRRTLHAVWTQPVDEQGKVVARIFHAQAKLPRK